MFATREARHVVPRGLTAFTVEGQRVDATSEKVIRFANAFSDSDVSEAATEKITGLLVDTIACAIVGARSAPASILARVARSVRSSPGATLFGYDIQTSPELAALANSTMVRTDDFNDAYFGHPSDMIPGMLAAAEVAHSSGVQLFTAIALAYEVYGAFSRSGPYHLESGIDYGLSMNVGVAVAVGKLWQLTEVQLAHAASLALVPNVPMGVARWGALSMLKGCNTAFAVRNGVFAAMLAKEGFTSSEEPYEVIFGLHHFTGPFELRLPLEPEKRVVERWFISSRSRPRTTR
jgi:2-methylcitrate dehydratase